MAHHYKKRVLRNFHYLRPTATGSRFIEDVPINNSNLASLNL